MRQQQTSLRTVLGSSDGFTLTELLVVLIIVGLLVVLAVPRFDAVVNRTKMTEAKLMLNQVHSLQQAYYLEHDRYADNLTALGFQQEILTSEGGNARYRVEIAVATDTSYLAKAVSVVDFDRDGTLNEWTINHRQQLQQAVAD